MNDENKPTTSTKQTEDENKENITTNNPESSSTEFDGAGPSTSKNKRKRGSDKEDESMKFEVVPSKRNRIAKRLIENMRSIIYEYSVTIGEQISGVFVDKPNAKNRDYKICGTQPLVNVMNDLKCSIDSEFDKSFNVEQKSTPHPSAILPSITIDGLAAKLEYMTQSHLRKFIPNMIKLSTGKNYVGWNDPTMKPKWWPNDIPWANIRLDARSDDQKEKESWNEALRRIISECYKFHGCEEMLNIEDVPNKVDDSSTSLVVPMPTLCSDVIPPGEEEKEDSIYLNASGSKLEGSDDNPIASTSTLAEAAPKLQNNLMYVVNTVGPSNITVGIVPDVYLMPSQNISEENQTLSLGGTKAKGTDSDILVPDKKTTLNNEINDAPENKPENI